MEIQAPFSELSEGNVKLFPLSFFPERNWAHLGHKGGVKAEPGAAPGSLALAG